MKSRKRNAGFTMAELLIVIAIMAILMGIAFMAVARYYRNLKQMEAESAAKEIFIAAQNHLSAAENQGLLESYRTAAASGGDAAATAVGVSPPATAVNNEEDQYCVCYPAADVAGILDVLLPYGAIDETVRTGGSYVIRYNLSSATVREVFFSFGTGKRFGANLSAQGSSDFGFQKLAEQARGADKLSARRNYTDHSVIGWYDGEDLDAPKYYLETPVIRVINDNTLRVEVDPIAVKSGVPEDYSGRCLTLIVNGVTSKAVKRFELVKNGGDQTLPHVTKKNGKYVVTLDDITRNGEQFAKVFASDNPNDGFLPIPGEDLTIWAVAFDNSILSNIAESGADTTNSLYGSLTKGAGGVPDTVTVHSFRHLENLDADISRFDIQTLNRMGAVSNPLVLTAQQTTDLDWNDFLDDEYTSNKVYKYGVGTAEGCYQPIIPTTITNGTVKDGEYEPSTMIAQEAAVPVDIALTYQGQDAVTSVSHSIRGVKVDIGGNAGLFDTLKAACEVDNLNLVNFDITSEPEHGGALAGALAGYAAGTLDHVNAYNDISPRNPDKSGVAQEDAGGESDSDMEDDRALSITAVSDTAGAAGGLAGSFNGTATSCAAALYVKCDGGSAGGLLGTMSGGSVTQSYSGGHTINGLYHELKEVPGKNPKEYEYTVRKTGAGRLNVQGKFAGGLIGTLSGGAVTDCYSTCSAWSTINSGAVGGFVGTASGGSTDSRCYCTGLVWGGTEADGTGGSRGAFAGRRSSSDLQGQYVNLANYRTVKTQDGQQVPTTEADLLPAVGGGGSESGLSALDANSSAYNSFFTSGGSRVETAEGRAYDPDLMVRGEKKANVLQFGWRPTSGQTLHYGDWPIYETQTVNE